MIGFIQYQIMSYKRSLKFVPPLTLFGVWVFILYTYTNVDILSSYGISSIAIYLIMTWVTMGLFSIEEESEKHILFINLGSKNRYLIGKFIICLIISLILTSIAIFYPIIIRAFKGPVMLVHYFLAIYSHFFFALFGILVGAFFSFSFVSKKYVWLLTVLVILLSLSYNGLVDTFPILKWILFILPPAINIIEYMEIGDNIKIGIYFWIDAVHVITYTIVLFLIVKRLFLVREK